LRHITQAIQEFQFNVMMTYVLMVLVMVIALDLLSARLRRRIAQCGDATFCRG